MFLGRSVRTNAILGVAGLAVIAMALPASGQDDAETTVAVAVAKDPDPLLDKRQSGCR